MIFSKLVQFAGWTIGILCIGLVNPAAGHVHMSPLFSDHMVLQRGQQVPIWGSAEPGEKITVQFAGQSRSARADASGRWQANLHPLRSNAIGRVMTVRGQAAQDEAKISDVLVGEVWLASGQSNMEYPVPHALNGKEEVAAANYPLLRFFTVKTLVAAQPANAVDGLWESCSSETVRHFSAVAYFFGRDLGKHLNVPVGIVHSSCSGTLAEAWTSPEVLDRDPDLQPINQRYTGSISAYHASLAQYQEKLKAWASRATAAAAAGTQFTDAKPAEPADPAALTTRPGGLFNGKIAPLIPFAIKGVIWWQGEYNSERCEQYKKLFPALIADWRHKWGQGNFPFLFVQLQNLDIQPQPNPAHYDEMREAQLFAYKTVVNSGMAVACDVGDAHDIHPPRKQPVAARLLLQARALAYRENLEPSGPVYQTFTIANQTIFVSFAHRGTGLKSSSGQQLIGFEVADATRVFHPAAATIVGDTVAVSSPEVASPVAVRYAWSDNPTPSLYNQSDLPASPFRTDDWPLHTSGLR